MRIRGTLPLAFCCALTAGGALAGEELRKAREAAALGSEARGFDIAMEGLKDSPGDRDLFLLAVELLPENSPARAKRLSAAAAEALAREPDDYAGYLGACKTLRVLGKDREALANCRKALEADPTAYPVYRELGLTYASSGNPRKAAEALEQGVEISSASYQARYYLARVLENRGDVVRAAARYREGYALAREAEGPDAARYRALLLEGQKRAGRAAGKKSSPGHADKAKAAAACLAKVREEYLKDNLGTALQQSDACLKLSPSDPALAAERAPMLVRLGRHEEGVREYERAAALYKDNRQAAALCRAKAAEASLKMGAPARAAGLYRLALKDVPGDLATLKGLAAAQEAGSDLKGAAETYAAILKLEPGNETARSRMEQLRDATLSPARILEEMKLRNAVDAKKKELSPEDAKLFRAIRAAELWGAADYLKGKARSTAGLLMTRQTPEGVKLLLTGPGYKAYIFHASKDAVRFFEQEKVDMREIFKLRTRAGAAIFDAAGKLTPEGEEFWRGAIPGRKTWLLSSEPVPESPKAVQANKAVAEAEANGYREIYEPEYLWLLRATDCPEEVMFKPPVNMLRIDDGAKVRFMLCYRDGYPCMNPFNTPLPGYIEAYRAGNDYISDAKTSTAFFGTGGVKKTRFCENGKVLGADMPEPPLPGGR